MRIFLIIICTLFCISCRNQNNNLLPSSLRCEYLEDPMGIDTGEPRFSWILESESMEVMQTAYEIMVAKEDNGFNPKSIVWSPGRISSGESVNISYQGMPLLSQTTYFWKVRIWDKQSGESRWSKVSAFHTGFLGSDTFRGKLINSPDSSLRSPLMRRTFSVHRKVHSAHVYATAVGLYELYINGSKVDDRLFEPATSQFTERLLYSVYDITDLLARGENVIGIWMGEGQAAFRPAPPGRFSNINMNISPFSRPMMLLDLGMIYDDGSKDIIATDESWKCFPSPITFNNYFGGEDYDARLEMPGWASPGYDEGEWVNVSEGEYHGKLSARLIPDVREGKTYEPMTVLQRDSHTWDYDFGTTIGGYWEITVEGKAGAEVIVRGTEKCGSSLHQKPLTEENQLNWENNHTGKFFYRDCYSNYILKGEGAEVYKPRFFYQGHRYLQVKISNPEDVKVLKVRNIEVGNALSQSGSFECSDEYLNNLHGMVVQTFKNNFIQGVPLSNPNSEKYGWTGDVHLFAEAAGYYFDLPAFWTKWMQDFPDAQKWAGMDGLIPVTVPELRKRSSLVSDVSWLAVYPFILMQMNQNYIDVRIIREHYESLKAWHQNILKRSDSFIYDGIWGDHLIPGIDKNALAASRGMTRLINTAYFYRVTRIMEEMAGMLQKSEEASFYRQTGEEIYHAFNQEFYDTGRMIYQEAPSPEGFFYELTSNLIPLQMELVPADRKQAVLDFVTGHIRSREYRSYTGILGTKAMIDVLQDEGLKQFLLDVIQNREFPGWGYTIETLGASTLNQNWNGDGDYNHCMYGSVNEFFYCDLLGINLQNLQSERQIVIEPFIPEDMTFARGSTKCAYGEIRSGWEKTDGEVQFNITVPHNTTAKLRIPFKVAEIKVLHGGGEITRGKENEYTLGSGTWIIQVPNEK